MRKVTYILLLLWPVCVLGQDVSVQKARLYAGEWLKRNPLAVQYQALHGTSITTGQIETLQLQLSDPVFYLVHLNPEGYLIMHSDLRLKPVLYFSFSGDPDLQDRNENALHQLLILQSQADGRTIAQTSQNHSASSEWNFQVRTQAVLQNYLTAASEPEVVGPLLQTLWNQIKYYNKFCPLDPNATALYDGRAPTPWKSFSFLPSFPSVKIFPYHQLHKILEFDFGFPP